MLVKWWIDDGYVNRKPDFELEIPDEDLEGLDESERERHIDACVQDEMWNRVSIGWKIVEKG